MKILYFDCFSGISGDMVLGAFIDLGISIDYLRKELTKLNLDGWEIKSKKVLKKGISATQVEVATKQERKHRKLEDIVKIINSSSLSEKIKKDSIEIFRIIAEAEAKIHGTTINNIHFHEAGATDSIIDIIGVAVCIDYFKPEKILYSEINTGSGIVKCAHGLLPVPAPATAEILKGMKICSRFEGELTTPTGAAILKHFAEYGNLQNFKTEKTGYGAGKQECKHPNVLRIFLGNQGNSKDIVNVIETNIDDMNPEFYDYIIERLLKSGALDVYITNIQMKKNRPGIKLTVIAKEAETDKIIKIIFEETTTLGVRIYKTKRIKEKREIRIAKTKYGDVEVKIGKFENHIATISPEYESCKKTALEKNIPIKDIYDEAKEIIKKNKK